MKMEIYRTDEQLIAASRKGDRFAVTQLVERHRRPVAATAFRALGNADDAQDVTQETLVYAVEHLADLRDATTFPAWLRHITLSRCADYRRRRGTRSLGEPMTVLNEQSEEATFVEHLLVREALAHLSPPHRTTLLLHYVGGWSLNEVADLLSIPVNTVRSRLMTAKSLLRSDLNALFPQRNPMSAQASVSGETFTSLVHAVFPGARIVSQMDNPEQWMPFGPRLHLVLSDGTEKIVDVRRDIDPDRAALLGVLLSLGIPGPRPLHPPVPNGSGHDTLCETPRGENLLGWALGGTPHRIRLATERTFEAIDRLQNATDALITNPVSAALPRRTLADEAALTESVSSKEWREDPWFAAALAKVKVAAADINTPLVFTDYLHFFPNFYRIAPGDDPFAEPMGWPGDTRLEKNPLAEFVSPFGYFGDPLLGLAMVWVYDCYPVVHTGFVEQFLWRRGVSQREFAPRLALKALHAIQRELPRTPPPGEDKNYRESLHGYVEQALGWM